MALGCVVVLAGLQANLALAGPSHAIAMHGEPAWPKDFARLPYADPQAPKAGRLVQGVLGTFDTLNPFVVRGLAAQSIRGYVIESLMARGYDEPFTLYGLLAQSVETDDERTFVSFTLNPAARFSDGKPVTAEDVVFSWQLLRDKGRPNHRTYYAKVKNAEITAERTVRFDLTGSNDRELPLILGLMPVLPRHAINPDTFEETTFEPPLGSGPYIVKDVQPGRSLLFVRNPDYWGKDLPINRGFWNFDQIRFDYYRDDNAYFEAFKKGLYDVRAELDPSRWQTGYDFPARRSGRVIKDSFPTGLPKGLSAFVFNTRRPVFADSRVREAIATLFDFDWVNQNFFFGLYARSASYFEGSELSSVGRPADERERKLLAPFPGAVRPDIMNGTWRPEASDGSGRDRDNLKKALALFAAAGFDLKNGVLRNQKTGQPLSFEFLVTSKDQERLALAFSRDLKRAGISVRVRVVDAVQYDRRRLTYDYDMIQNRWDQSLSPGNEQHFYWSSEAAGVDGTRNYMGARSPAVDAMIAALLRARGREEFVSAVRALDRALISGFYVVPLFHLPEQWVARWSHIEHPKTTSLFGYLPETWWRKPETQ
ncbi:MAG: extracellular solute-binding protein [Pseudorhodoplanes sp.]|jgi:peptide/nickel transport system substrate-binding protein|nr:extracellular solute-binding protein [Pseudorhodoplanes sp.]